jgi:transcriptional regulator with XRE-family HTH domain
MLQRDERAGRYFQHARENAGLDQRAATLALGISVGTLSRYENGKAAISEAMQQRMASLYMVEPDGWRTPDDKEAAPGGPGAGRDAPASFDYADPRYWSARWDQAVVSLRAVLREQEDLAEEMREAVYRPYRQDSVRFTPPATPEALDRAIAAQIPPDVQAVDEPERVRG